MLLDPGSGLALAPGGVSDLVVAFLAQGQKGITVGFGMSVKTAERVVFIFVAIFAGVHGWSPELCE